MSRAYICTVSNSFPENYGIGIGLGKWGVEERYASRIAPVRPGDLLIFAVGGEFRSIHAVLTPPYVETELVWPPKNGDIFPHRISIGPALTSGRIRVAELAPSISFMRGKRAWGGTLQGPNGVFNSRATAEDVQLITVALQANAEPTVVAAPDSSSVEGPRILAVDPTYWLPGFLDRLASLARLQRSPKAIDPFAGAESWRRGLLTGVYSDVDRTPTIAVAPIERSADGTVLATLYGLASLRHVAPSSEVRGVIFVHEMREDVGRLVSGVPNISAVGFDVHVSLRDDLRS
jgi:hypothetical protein